MSSPEGIAIDNRDPRRWRGWPLQLALSLPSTALAATLFVVGFQRYVDAAVAPKEAIEIVATAEKWRWTFTYPNGESASELRAPVGRPVHVTIHSREVAQRLDLPALRVGAEARPDADGSLWFTATRAGESPLLGGDAPAEMIGKLALLEPAAFDHFLDDGAQLPPAQYGRALYAKMACQACHSLDGTPGTAPSFKGLFDKMETLSDGTTVHVDDAYVRESILDPMAKVVRGFQPVMPAFAGQLSDKQIDALIAFVKSVPR